MCSDSPCSPSSYKEATQTCNTATPFFLIAMLTRGENEEWGFRILRLQPQPEWLSSRKQQRVVAGKAVGMEEV